jgi:hypothetical protein
MKIVFDQGTPAPLRRHLAGHSVTTLAELGWSALENGNLLAAAESAGFNLLISTDQHLKHQQNLSGRTLAVLVLQTTSYPRIRRDVHLVLDAVDVIGPGGYMEVGFP